MAKNGLWILLCAAVVATGTLAQPTADESLMHRKELVRRCMTAAHFDDQMKSLSTTLLPMILEQTEKQYPDTPEQVTSAIRSSAAEAMAAFIPKLEDRVADVMAAKFSVEELEQVTAFYESPVGQKIITKSGDMMSSLQPLMRDLIPGLQADMLRRLCAKIDCSTLPKPSPT